MVIVERYRRTRFWAVYEDGKLLCVTVYKKGANAVRERLESSVADRVKANQMVKLMGTSQSM